MKDNRALRIREYKLQCERIIPKIFWKLGLKNEKIKNKQYLNSLYIYDKDILNATDLMIIILKKHILKNIEIVETKFNGSRTICCGDDLYPKLPVEKVHKQMKKRADSMPCEDVIVYCVSCIKSFHIGGKTPRHLIDLLMNESTEPQIYDTVKWHEQLQEYIDAH